MAAKKLPMAAKEALAVSSNVLAASANFLFRATHTEKRRKFNSSQFYAVNLFLSRFACRVFIIAYAEFSCAFFLAVFHFPLSVEATMHGIELLGAKRLSLYEKSFFPVSRDPEKARKP